MNRHYLFGRLKKPKKTRFEIAQIIGTEPLDRAGTLNYYFEKQPYELGQAFSQMGDNLPQYARDWESKLESHDLNVNRRGVFNPGWTLYFRNYTLFYRGRAQAKLK